MARLIFENISMKDAKIFANWYEGQGEQDADVWFEDRDSRAPHVDIHHKQWLRVDKINEEVVVQLKANG